MGGKRLKFPSRKKYVDQSGIVDAHDIEEKPVSEEEHQKRVEMLKKMGLLK